MSKKRLLERIYRRISVKDTLKIIYKLNYLIHNFILFSNVLSKNGKLI